MRLPELRSEIAAVCGQLTAAGLVVGTAGNVSARAGDLIAVTPSGLDYAALSAELVGGHRLDGKPVEAPLAPSSERPLCRGCRPSTTRSRRSAGRWRWRRTRPTGPTNWRTTWWPR